MKLEVDDAGAGPRQAGAVEYVPSRVEDVGRPESVTRARSSRLGQLSAIGWRPTDAQPLAAECLVRLQARGARRSRRGAAGRHHGWRGPARSAGQKLLRVSHPLRQLAWLALEAQTRPVAPFAAVVGSRNRPTSTVLRQPRRRPADPPVGRRSRSPRAPRGERSARPPRAPAVPRTRPVKRASAPLKHPGNSPWRRPGSNTPAKRGGAFVGSPNRPCPRACGEREARPPRRRCTHRHISHAPSEGHRGPLSDADSQRGPPSASFARRPSAQHLPPSGPSASLNSPASPSAQTGACLDCGSRVGNSASARRGTASEEALGGDQTRLRTPEPCLSLVRRGVAAPSRARLGHRRRARCRAATYLSRSQPRGARLSEGRRAPSWLPRQIEAGRLEDRNGFEGRLSACLSREARRVAWVPVRPAAAVDQPTRWPCASHDGARLTVSVGRRAPRSLAGPRRAPARAAAHRTHSSVGRHRGWRLADPRDE